MNQTDRAILISYRNIFSSDVDPISLADTLHHLGLLSKKQKIDIYEISVQCPERVNVWNTLISLILIRCNLLQFLQALYETGYTHLAYEISHRCRHANYSRVQVINRANCDSNQRVAQKLFMNLKINTHNNIFVNPRQYCHEEGEKYKEQLRRCQSTSDLDSIRLADKRTAFILGEIDSYIMLYEKKCLPERLFKDLKNIIVKTSNSNVTELSYHSRIAIVAVIGGDHEEAEEHIKKAMQLSLLVGRCVEISNFLYIYVFFLLSTYEDNPIKDLREKCLRIAEMGLQSVEDEDEPIREFWLRIFLLRMIYCLLGLSYKGYPIVGLYVDKNNIRKAKELLADTDKMWRTIETRRKIMYYVAKARIAELEEKYGYIYDALFYIRKAIEIGEEGNYGETRFIQKYEESIKQKSLLHVDFRFKSTDQFKSNLLGASGCMTSFPVKNQIDTKDQTVLHKSFDSFGPSLEDINDNGSSHNYTSYSLECNRVDRVPNTLSSISTDVNYDLNSGQCPLNPKSITYDVTLLDTEGISLIACNDSHGNTRHDFTGYIDEPIINLHPKK